MTATGQELADLVQQQQTAEAADLESGTPEASPETPEESTDA